MRVLRTYHAAHAIVELDVTRKSRRHLDLTCALCTAEAPATSAFISFMPRWFV